MAFHAASRDKVQRKPPGSRSSSACSSRSSSSMSGERRGSTGTTYLNRIQLQRKCDSWRAEVLQFVGELDERQMSELRAAAQCTERQDDVLGAVDYSFAADWDTPSGHYLLRAPLPGHQ
eukprot:Sspe_Gene.120078::Locus_117779_Transcript_1_1_Confidence_1.000_Length_384::g.120078::m.120078